MREDANTSTFAITAGIFLFFAVMVNAFIGTTQVSIHPECLDGIDNDGDISTDMNDIECAIYPYEDGNGESHTPESQRRSTDGGEYEEGNAWNYLLIVQPPEIDPCSDLVYSAVYQPEAVEAYDAWYMPNCGA